jgi:hypothetical protein
MNKINRIVAYGCSFTAGDELTDSTIHPDSDSIKKTQGLTYWKEVHSHKLTKEMILENHRLSWAGQVAEKLELPFTGKAAGGSSMMCSLLELERAIANNEITPTTLVLFGTTTKERTVYFSKKRPKPKSVLLNYPEFWPVTSLDQKTVLEIYNDGYLIYNHLMCLHRLIQLSEMLNNRIKVVQVVRTLNFKEDNYNISKDDLKLMEYKYYEIYDHMNFYGHRDLFEFCSKENKKVDLHGGNHPKSYVHKKFSEYILETLGC